VVTANDAAMPRKKESKGDKKDHTVFREFKSGDLKSSSGDKVVSRKQAIAIALSERERVGRKKKKK
jgi:hypothetical protein